MGPESTTGPEKPWKDFATKRPPPRTRPARTGKRLGRRLATYGIEGVNVFTRTNRLGIGKEAVGGGDAGSPGRRLTAKREGKWWPVKKVFRGGK